MNEKASHDKFEKKVSDLTYNERINKILLAISNAAITVFSTQDLLEAIHNSLKDIIDVTNFGIALYDDRNDMLKYHYFVDEKNDIDNLNELLECEESKSFSPIMQVFYSKSPRLFKKNEQLLMSMEMKRDYHCEPSEIWMGIPLTYNDQVIGVLSVQHYTDANAYGEAEQDILSTFSEQIAIGITKKQSDDVIRFNQKRIRTITKESEKRFRIIAETANDAIIIFDEHENIIFWNNTAKSIFGYVTGETMGTLLKTIIVEEDQKKLNTEIKRILTTDYSEFIGKAVEMTGVKKGNIQFPIELSLSTWKTNHEVFFTIIIRDITERKKSEEQILYLAYYDQLTKLPNRTFFIERLSHTIGAANRYERMAAILFLDLDDFKIVNDTLGHEAGDLLLQEVAKRLLSCIRKSDLIARSNTNELVDIVARMGGDEFTICLTEIKQVEDAAIVAKRIIDALAKPITIFGNELYIGTSIGISIYPSDSHDPVQLLKNADMSMYDAKKSGKNSYHFYSSSLNDYLTHKKNAEADLQRALENNELFLLYQPTIDLYTDEVIGFEALLRWQHPEKGILMPGEIYPISEDEELLLPIQNFILKNVNHYLNNLEKKGLRILPISIPLFIKSLKSVRIFKSIFDYLTTSEVHIKYLDFEVSEQFFKENFDTMLERLKKLQKIGVKISLNDFGISYSSFNIFKNISVDFLKTSPSFLKNIPHNKYDTMLIKGVIAIAQSLNIPTLIRGVENESQQSFLKDLSCNAAQGPLLSGPLTYEEIESLLQKKHDAT